MVNIYFIKRLFELLLVQRVAGRLISMQKLLWLVLAYWFGFAFLTFYSIYHPEYTPSTLISDSLNQELKPLGYGCIGIFLFSQLMSLLCHWHFILMSEKQTAIRLGASRLDMKDLPAKNRLTDIVASQSKLVVLSDYGFSFVTCADKFWDLLSWLMFVVITQTMQGYLFLLGYYILQNNKAQTRHWRYIAEYRLNYPKDRKTLIPYLI